MLAYRKSDFDLFIKSEEDSNLQSPFYSQNIFARIGLFIFGSFAAAATLGFLTIISKLGSASTSISVALFIFSIACIALVEVLIHKPKPYFRAGLEEAILYAGLASFIGALAIVLKIKWSFHFEFTLIMAGILFLAAIRYVDSLLVLSAYLLTLFSIFDFCLNLAPWSKAILPFVVIVFGLISVQFLKWIIRQDVYRFWKQLFVWLRFAALILVYIGGNYFVVRELNQNLSDYPNQLSVEIPFAMFFNAFTYLAPWVYLALGLFKKDRQLLYVGFISIALMVYTFRYYYHIIPVETALTVGGLFLIGAAWATIKFFKVNRFGVTVVQDLSENKKNIANVESLMILNSFASSPNSISNPNTNPSGTQPGDGKFGGGGAGGTF